MKNIFELINLQDENQIDQPLTLISYRSYIFHVIESDNLTSCSLKLSIWKIALLSEYSQKEKSVVIDLFIR